MLSQKRIMLLVTENCNLNCVYCYEHEKNSKIMTFDRAKEILNAQLADYESSEPVVIEVFGGEAFANFSLIRQIEEYLSQNYSHLQIFYETTTNGTLVHGEVQKWLAEHKDQFFIALSLDGTQDMHDRNRKFANGKGSFTNIDLEFFARTWPGCPAKMTVSENTLPNLAEGVIYLDSLGFKCDTTLSVGIEWDYEKNRQIFIQELEKLIDYYVENPEKELCTLLNMDLRLVFAPIDEDYRFCGAGLDMVCFDTAGNQYPCQGFAPVSLGREAEKYKNFDNKKFRFSSENSCKNCSWVRLCPNCYAANLQSTGDIQKVDTVLCQFYKYCILASAKIQYKRILARENLTKEDQLILKAVLMIQDQLM